MTDDNERPLYQSIRQWPQALVDQRVAAQFEDLLAAAGDEPTSQQLKTVLGEDAPAALVRGVLSGSPYLTSLMLRDPARLLRVLVAVPEHHEAKLAVNLASELAAVADMASAMKALRLYKNEMALLIALCDLAGIWPVMRATQALTITADATLQGAVRFLFRQAHVAGQWTGEPSEQGSGYIVLAMGKYGAHELNYSSDIDLIVFFEPELARTREGLEPQTFFVGLTRDLVRLMDERTADGYVFRTDLRLRPDSGATQVALSTQAALIYYESFGQNWERAALIKARAAAGDITAGESFLQELSPFVWRKYLDFAAIADVHAMKRQIHAHRGFSGIAVPGHNIKLGPGGIREIEFFVQTQQLIAGGRQRELRSKRTIEALSQLAEHGWIKPQVKERLAASYLFLRQLEHRVQMVADEQTHELPQDAAGLESLSRFAGYPDLASFTSAVSSTLEEVQKHYSVLFEDAPALTSGGTNMVFAGEADDPSTVEALRKLGFVQPSQVIAAVRAWHHGRYPAVRSPRARERLTEMQVRLLTELANTADPDAAFTGFDRFLSKLPAGVQLFSLLKANPGLMRLVADIMGTAPRLAGVLSRRRRLLDAVLDPRSFSALPDAGALDEIISGELADAEDFQLILDRARVVGSEQAFLIGVRVLSGKLTASEAGLAYALIAERLIVALQRAVEAEMEQAHGRVPQGSAAVIAMGKLGGREMTATSDIDLIVVYDFAADAIQSDGPRPLSPTQYYTRFTQRLITALSSPTAEGSLYEVDMRLRPSGQKGPVATQLSSFVDYQSKEAWTWERMALTRARVLTGEHEFKCKVEAAVQAALCVPAGRDKLAADVVDMRSRIATEKGTSNIWDLKQVRGGLVDLEFIAQYLQLLHAHRERAVLDQNTIEALRQLHGAGVLTPAQSQTLIAAAHLVHDLTQIIRLCLDVPFDPASAPPGLKELIARAANASSFEAAEGELKKALGDVHQLFDELVV